MIIVLGSQKGGVGKSTLAVSIAAYLMSLGNRVIIVDADDQKSVLTWYNNRPEDLPHIPVTGATGNIKAMLKEHEKSYDFVIADCAGRDSAEMRSGLMAADVFISPLRPSQMDLDVVPHTCSVLMNPLMILVKIIKLRWIHILSYDQMVSRKINNQTTRCANSIF
ncbi:division plane positioning ATPase MipZ, partial [Klebsiella pneumoniae]|uniref:division plane positioning ATPase MipZ n=2 Tax=Klebsiella pneumoniae TaxID=573 RepID=UPI001D0E0DEB